MTENAPMIYYVTVSPAPNKVENGQAFQCIHDIYQKERIMRVLNESLIWHKYEKPVIHFEYNKKHNVHAHFTVKFLNIRTVKQFQINVARNLGSKKLCPDICCNMCHESNWRPKNKPNTEIPYESWEEYCDKENVLPPQEVRCRCIDCRATYDKRVIDRVETGEIRLV